MVKPGYMKRILDGYRTRLEVKGGFTWSQYTHVFITSNLAPSEWWPRALTAETQAPVARRLHNVYEIETVLFPDMAPVYDMSYERTISYDAEHPIVKALNQMKEKLELEYSSTITAAEPPADADEPEDEEIPPTPTISMTIDSESEAEGSDIDIDE